MAAAFSSMRTLCTLLPARTPKQLIAVKPSRVTAAIGAIAPARSGDLAIVAANVTATAAIPPVCVTSRSTQP